MSNLQKYPLLRDRALKTQQSFNDLTKSLTHTTQLLNSVGNDLKDYKTNKLVQESAIKVLREIIDTLSTKQVNAIVDMVTYALSTIFHDRKYSLSIDIADTRTTKGATLYLIDKTDPENTVKSDMDSIGGGIMSVIGFVLQIFFIIYFKKQRFLLLDESLSAVSSTYIPNLMEFMKTLSEKRGFTFVMILQDLRFMEYANKTYVMRLGKLEEVEE